MQQNFKTYRATKHKLNVIIIHQLQHLIAEKFTAVSGTYEFLQYVSSISKAICKLVNQPLENVDFSTPYGTKKASSISNEIISQPTLIKVK